MNGRQRFLTRASNRSSWMALLAIPLLALPATAAADEGEVLDAAGFIAKYGKGGGETELDTEKPGGKDKDKAAADKKKEASVEEQARLGVVGVLRGGQAIGLGAVLGGDGRVLTALSTLGHGNDLEIRYADGSTVRAKLGHHDRVWDLALLVPQAGKWTNGLVASGKDPVRADAALRSYTQGTSSKASASPLTLRGRKTLLGSDDTPLTNALEIGSRISPKDLGSPMLDEENRVIGIVGRGCAPTEEGKPCTPVAFGIPVSAIKNFLRNVPATAIAPPAWLGIQGVKEVGQVAKGVRVLVVHPQSPAEEAGLKGGEKGGGDMILAVGGIPVTTPEALSVAIRERGIGEKVAITIFRDGKYMEIPATLRSTPDAQPASAPAPTKHPAELPPLPDAPRPEAPKQKAPKAPASPPAPEQPRAPVERGF